MAAGDVAPWERTEEPSPRRLREARLDGRIARSPDLATACLVLGAAAMVTLGGGVAFRRLGDFLAASLDPSRSLADPAAVGGAALEGVVAGASIVVPAGVALVAIAWLAGVGQVGLVLTTRPLSPRPARLSPAANLAGLASGRSLRRLVTDAAKVVAVVAAAWWAIGGEAGSIVSLASMPLADGAAAAAGLLGRLAFAVGTALLAVGLVDWLLERRRIHGELRMTRREAAEDRKETEGDPAWRRRRFEFARGLAAAPAVAMRNAAAIVVGRERGAIVRSVAIEIPAAGEPRIAALGFGEAAARLAALAAAAGVPIVDDSALAESIAPAGARPGQAVARREALLERLARVPGIAGRLGIDGVPA